MDFPSDTDLTWCVEHEIAYPKWIDCPCCVRDIVIKRGRAEKEKAEQDNAWLRATLRMAYTEATEMLPQRYPLSSRTINKMKSALEGAQ